jgi:tetratricopeptide (TPR) repeat protein
MRTRSLLLCLALGLAAVPAHADPPASDELEGLDARLLDAPTDLDAHLRRAETLIRMGDPRAALDDVRTAETLAPSDGRTPLLRAWCLLVLGETDAALAALDEGAIERAPRPGEALALRARIAIALGADEAARRDLDRALVLLAEPDLYLLRARVETRLGLDSAPGLTEGLLRTGSVVLEAELVEVLLRSGRAEEALERVASSALPSLRRTLATARLYDALGRASEARASAERAEREARARTTERPTAARHLELALALSLLGRCEEAREHHDTAAALSPRYATVEHPGLGSVSRAVGTCGGAR